MHEKEKKFYLYGIFILMFLWDILDQWLKNSPFLFLIILFIIYIIQNKKIKINKGVIFLAIYIVIHGLFNIFTGNDVFKLFIIQFGAIMVCYVAYSTLTMEYSIVEIFRVYKNSACVMSLIGIFELIIGLLNIEALAKLPIVFTFTNYNYRVLGFVKLASLCMEPSFLGYYLAPIVCLILFNLFSPENIPNELKHSLGKPTSILILCCYIFTFSAIAYVGLIVMVFLIWWLKGVSLKKLTIPIAAILIFGLAYVTIPDINLRINDTFTVFTKGDSNSSVNLSTYTYYSNYGVMKKSLMHSAFMGSGLGSYQLSYDKFAIGAWGESGLMLNKEDGNSAFFRIITELGIIGIMGVAYFIIKFFVGKKSKMTCYSCAILTLLIMFLIRQGNYTHGGSILFVYLYFVIYKENKYINKIQRMDLISKEKTREVKGINYAK